MRVGPVMQEDRPLLPAMRSGRGISRAAIIASLTVILAVSVTSGLMGIDFGKHWDEGPAQIDPLTESLRERTLLPGFYIYPSLNYWINLGSLLPEMIRGLVGPESVLPLLMTTASSISFLLRLRTVHVLLTSLGVLWTYLAVREFGRSTWEGVLAASLVGFSWEVAYHARWVAPDSLVMQFASLWVWLLARYVRSPSQRSLILATIAAAFACGTKYPGGLLLIPILAISVPPPGQARRVLRSWLTWTVILGVFVVTFIITTPGAVFQPWSFTSAISNVSDWYLHRGHYGYTVPPGLPHLARILLYLAGSFLSPFPFIAVPFFLLSTVAAVDVLLRRGPQAWVLLLFPVAYVAYFGSQRVMIVRNLLVLAPFLAILGARGATLLFAAIRRNWTRHALVGIIATALAANAIWLVQAALSIVERGDRPTATLLRDYIQARPNTQFLLSLRLWEELGRLPTPLPPNAISDPSLTADVVAVYAFEAMPILEWPANDPRLTLTTLGPLDVNFNYYPTWEANDRIVILTYEKALEVGVDFVESGGE